MTLDEGAERGVRALAFSTGGGLDFWAMTDRSFDIGPLWFKGIPLAWQSPSGFSNPMLTRSEHDAGHGVGRMLSGLLMTCGLDHVRQPDSPHPLHGHFPMTPARLLTSAESWDCATPTLIAEAEVIQYRLGAECLRLKRCIAAPIGDTALTIQDTVTNDSSHVQVHDILYHFNLGHPLVTDGGTVELNGRALLGPIQMADQNGTSEARCISSGNASTAQVRILSAGHGAKAICLDVSFGTASLPYLQVWQDLRPACGLLAIEPCASGRLPGGRSEQSTRLEPGESRNYSITLRFSEIDQVRTTN